jgi:hypothetical protein
LGRGSRVMAREKILLLIAVISILIYSSINVLIPLRARVAHNYETIPVLAKQLELAKQPMEERKLLNQEVQNLQARLELLNKRVPHEVENAEMIILLSTLTEKYNLHQTHLSESRDRPIPAGTIEKENQLAANTFFWKGSGYYSDVKGFIKALEECDRLLEISDVKLVKGVEVESATVNGVVYNQEVASKSVTEPELGVSFYIKTYYDPAGTGSSRVTAYPEGEETDQGEVNPFE